MKHRRKKVKKIIVISFLIILFILFCYFILYDFLYKEILYPSYLSVVSVCHPEGEQILKDNGYVVAGSAIRNESGAFMIIYQESKETLKHEYCHIKQFERGFPIGNCKGFLPIKYLSEIEAYSCEYLNDNIYNKIYGEIENVTTIS